jgi:hypothetical protein
VVLSLSAVLNCVSRIKDIFSALNFALPVHPHFFPIATGEFLIFREDYGTTLSQAD